MGIFLFPRSLLQEDSAASEETPAYRPALAPVQRVGLACMSNTSLPAPTEWSALLIACWRVRHRSAATRVSARAFGWDPTGWTWLVWRVAILVQHSQSEHLSVSTAHCWAWQPARYQAEVLLLPLPSGLLFLWTLPQLGSSPSALSPQWAVPLLATLPTGLLPLWKLLSTLLPLCTLPQLGSSPSVFSPQWAAPLLATPPTGPPPLWTCSVGSSPSIPSPGRAPAPLDSPFSGLLFFWPLLQLDSCLDSTQCSPTFRTLQLGSSCSGRSQHCEGLKASEEGPGFLGSPP